MTSQKVRKAVTPAKAVPPIGGTELLELSPLTLPLSPANGGEGGLCTVLVQGGGEGEWQKSNFPYN
jgi:hypothetical protein